MIKMELKAYQIFWCNPVDFTRFSTLIDRDEKNRMNARNINTKKIVSPVRINQLNISYFIPVDIKNIKYDDEWIITVNCPFCRKDHYHKSGNNIFPDMNNKIPDCSVNDKYEFRMDEKILLIYLIEKEKIKKL